MDRWIIRNYKYEDYGGKNGAVSPILLKILANRGIIGDAAVDEFLAPDISRLHPPRLMKDMDKAVTVASQSIKAGEKILVVGDYDVDGVISTYVMYSGLKACGADADYAIPHRVTDGYGISDGIINEAISKGVRLLITCDNGISAVRQIETAKAAGMSVIITDHHEISEALPPADAIVDHRQADCGYPFKQLCGAAVAWKFITALFGEFGRDPGEALAFVEFVAIATVCDIVDLLGENRVIVKTGLEMIDRTSNLGLRALLETTGAAGKPVTAYTLGFILGPCINATGRLEHADAAMRLLFSRTEAEAAGCAANLVKLNTERQALTDKGFKASIAAIESGDHRNDNVIVAYISDMHESVAGIIAGRIKDKLGKPAIVLVDSAEEGIKGSGRSVEGYDMYRAVNECRDLLQKYGGHPMAVGLSMAKDNIGELRSRMNAIFEEQDADTDRKIMLDMSIPPQYLDMRLGESLKLLEPHGKGNEKPVFGLKNVAIARIVPVGSTRKYFRMKLACDNGSELNAMYFGDADGFAQNLIEDFGRAEFDRMLAGAGKSGAARFDVAFTAGINEYRGDRSLQLVITGCRASSAAEHAKEGERQVGA